MKLEGSKTEKNLMKAFLGESGARNRYTFYASKAKKEGYEQIAEIFLETANNESQHAKQFLKFLGNNAPFEVTGKFPIGIGSTLKNLEIGFEGEHEENTILYPEFSLIAYEEGFYDIGECFKLIVEIEKHHEARYRALYQNILNNEVFKKPNPVNWFCRKCGNILTEFEAPKECPVCHHPRAYFEMLCDNF